MSKQSISTFTRVLVTVLLPILALITVDVGEAMAQTPAGTTITNTATVDWTDANSNAYDAVQASVGITVAFAAGMDLQAPSDFAPAVNASGSQVFTIVNTGNGTDSVEVTAFTNSNESVLLLANVTYTATLPASLGGGAVPGGPFASLAALNTALAAVEIPLGESITITANYFILPNTGGLTTTLSMSVASRTTGTVTDTDSMVLAPTLQGALEVKDAVGASRLPGGSYTVDFTVSSTLNGNETVDLTATLLSNTAGATITNIENVTDGGSAASNNLDVVFAQNDIKTIRVTYSIPTTAVTANSFTVQLTATAESLTGVADDQDTPPVIEIIVPAITITKTVTDQSDGSGSITTAAPGDVIYYVVTITNAGDGPATGVVVTDVIPAELTYQAIQSTSGSVAWDASNPSYSAGTKTVTGNIAAMASGENAVMVIRAVVN